MLKKSVFFKGVLMHYSKKSFFVLVMLSVFQVHAMKKSPSYQICPRDAILFQAEYPFIDNEEITCSICWDILNEQEHSLECTHAFHNVCIEEWLEKAPDHNCPICRRPVAKSFFMQIYSFLYNIPHNLRTLTIT